MIVLEILDDTYIFIYAVYIIICVFGCTSEDYLGVMADINLMWCDNEFRGS